jgi:peroxiredoxin 2/4
MLPVGLSTFGSNSHQRRKAETIMSTIAEMTETARLPRLGETAPDFIAKSTHGEIRLSDFTAKGKWVLLFSHPSDFTPVCTTEFVEFARRWPEFDALGVQLIGVSIDSIYSHIAWVRDIEEHAKVEVKFPVVADLDQRVARLYGMVHEAVADTAAVRAVFAIDPKQKVRTVLYYPMQLGRSIDELLRVFQGLQTVDANGVSCPADWKPGEAVIVPAPATQADAAKRANGGGAGLDVKTWYLSKKELEVKPQVGSKN